MLIKIATYEIYMNRTKRIKCERHFISISMEEIDELTILPHFKPVGARIYNIADEIDHF